MFLIRSAASLPKLSNMSDEEEYQVEKILDHAVKRGKHLYLIKWEGYGSDANTWEPLGKQFVV